MENKRRASEMDRDENEYDGVLQYLPPRFREISTNSAAMENFNLMNNDLIEHRILPRLDMRHLHHHIVYGRSGPIRDRLLNVIEPRSKSTFQSLWTCPSLLFHGALNTRRIKFYDCAIRDKRLPPFPDPVRERDVRLPALLIKNEYQWGKQPFMEAVGQKVVYWSMYDRIRPFLHIMNVDHNRNWYFSTLDTTAICGEIEREYERSGIIVNYANLILTAVVGHRLVVLLQLKLVGGPLDIGPTHMLAFDANTETWKILPECPGAITRSCIPISWKRKLYLVDFKLLQERRPLHDIVPLHFDFESNMWKSVTNTVTERDPDENIIFALRLMELPFPESYLYYFGKFERQMCIKSSRSGTLYAVYRDGPVDNTSLEVYAMDDLKSGWSNVDLFQSECAENHFSLFDPPPISLGWFSLWEVNERDMLFLAVHYERAFAGLRMTKSMWWIFNKEDGIKTFNSESWPGNTDDISALRVGW